MITVPASLPHPSDDNTGRRLHRGTPVRTTRPTWRHAETGLVVRHSLFGVTVLWVDGQRTRVRRRHLTRIHPPA
jgi:hypothetical protein